MDPAPASFISNLQIARSGTPSSDTVRKSRTGARPSIFPGEMPFTLAHPAAILPFLRLSRTNGWRSGLLWGSLSPDLIAVPLVSARSLSHSLPGLVLLDVPLAMLLAFLWSAFGRDRLRRLPGLTFPPTGVFSWRASLLGATLGGATHLFWDLFTHERLPDFIPCSVCSTKLFDTPAGPFLTGQLSWYVNSALGVAIVLAWLLVVARRSPGWPMVFLSPVWLRLLFIPLVPIVFFLLGVHPGPDHPIRDIFLHATLYPGRVRRLVVVSGGLGLFLLAWESRSRPAAATSNGANS